MNKVSLIVTVLNEEKTIDALFNSIIKQTLLPTELVIVDGGSSDKTVEKINQFSKSNQLNIIVKIKKGNRSIGRNYAILQSKNNLIAITDAGCVLDKNWLKELVKSYETNNNSINKVPVVAGFYAATNDLTKFQKAVVPYVLVMPDKVNEQTFLPATRSMLIEKNVFNKLGGFNENYSDNEDYVFARLLAKKNIPIAFAGEAIVYWIPVKTIREFYKMIFRFAYGDVYAKIIRPKVLLIFARYFLFFVGLYLSLKFDQLNSFIVISVFLLLNYSIWAIRKNIKYVGNSWYYLPLLQFSSDFAVMQGSLIGLIKTLFK